MDSYSLIPREPYPLGLRVVCTRPIKNIKVGTQGTVVAYSNKEYLRVQWDFGYNNGYSWTKCVESGRIMAIGNPPNSFDKFFEL